MYNCAKGTNTEKLRCRPELAVGKCNLVDFRVTGQDLIEYRDRVYRSECPCIRFASMWLFGLELQMLATGYAQINSTSDSSCLSYWEILMKLSGRLAYLENQRLRDNMQM